MATAAFGVRRRLQKISKSAPACMVSKSKCFMARIKPQALLLQSKKKKGPTRISVTTIVMCNLIIALIALSLVASYRYWSRRSLDHSGWDFSASEEMDAFAKKDDLPGFAHA